MTTSFRRHRLENTFSPFTTHAARWRPPAAIQHNVADGTSPLLAIWARFSGGVKQRILFRPALCQPRIPFLDEATSHLDVAREKAIKRTVKCPPDPRDVAHRPERPTSADRVIVLGGAAGKPRWSSIAGIKRAARTPSKGRLAEIG